MRSIFISVTKAPNFLKDSCILSFVSFRLVRNLGKSRAAHVYGGIYHQRCVISRIFIQLMRLMAISYIYSCELQGKAGVVKELKRSFGWEGNVLQLESLTLAFKSLMALVMAVILDVIVSM